MLSPHVWVFYAAFLVAFLLTPLARGIALRLGVVDRPDQDRKRHRRPVAYLGGLAVFLGWLAGILAGHLVGLYRRGDSPATSPAYEWGIWGIALGGAVVLLVGLLDDVRGVRPLGKVAGQSVAAGLLLASGVGTECTRPALEMLLRYLYPLAGGGAFDSPAPPAWFPALVALSSGVLVVVVVVGCCNATNLLDGMDGLCGGVTAVVAAGFVFVAVHLAVNGGGPDGAGWDARRVALGLALLGAVLAFVPYNFNPASIFMGDAGSNFLGFACAVSLVLFAQAHPKWFLAGTVMFALPLLDTALAFARRWVAGRPLFSADAKHFHHQLVERGLSVRRAVVACYGLAVLFAALGAVVAFTRTRYAAAVYLVTFGFILVAAFKMGMVHERAERRVGRGRLERLELEEEFFPDRADADLAALSYPRLASGGARNRRGLRGDRTHSDQAGTPAPALNWADDGEVGYVS